MRNILSELFLLLFVLFLLSCRPDDSPQTFREISENGKNYLIQDSLLIDTRDGAKIAAIVVRNKLISEPQAAILFHTIYARATDLDRAKKAADRGYIGVVTYTRGKGLSPDEITPYEFEANDTYDVIDWISKQGWSNGKVGMYGGSYVGFVQWAATKKLHPALKTIVPSAAAAPGIAEPMENGVYANFHYPWTFYVTDNKYLDTTLYNDNQRWFNLYQRWYEKGVAYRALDSLDGLPNPFFSARLNHPTYDSYWQKMMPFQTDFSHINIPVLSTTGYYDGGQIGALYYLKEHYKYNPQAEHYLLIGPFGHFGAQTVPDTTILGYSIDPVARINITNIIFDWFDYILKDGPKPEILQDKINYEVMGANKWEHAPSLSAISNDTLRFYLTSEPSGLITGSTFSGNNGSDQHFALSLQKPEMEQFITQQVDFADRRPEAQNNYFTPVIINEDLALGNGFSFISPPFEADTEVNGSYFGELKVMINKKDLDCSIVLYEQRPDGTYFELTLPFIGRASLAKDRSQRQLLVPDEISTIPFTNVRMTSKKLSKGSRLVVVLNVNKHPFEQINYGSGKDVSDETMVDAGAPLRVKWYNDSFINIPIKK